VDQITTPVSSPDRPRHAYCRCWLRPPGLCSTGSRRCWRWFVAGLHQVVRVVHHCDEQIDDHERDEQEVSDEEEERQRAVLGPGRRGDAVPVEEQRELHQRVEALDQVAEQVGVVLAHEIVQLRLALGVPLLRVATLRSVTSCISRYR